MRPGTVRRLAPVESREARYPELFDVVVRSLRRQAEERAMADRVDERRN